MLEGENKVGWPLAEKGETPQTQEGAGKLIDSPARRTFWKEHITPHHSPPQPQRAWLMTDQVQPQLSIKPACTPTEDPKVNMPNSED